MENKWNFNYDKSIIELNLENEKKNVFLIDCYFNIQENYFEYFLDTNWELLKSFVGNINSGGSIIEEFKIIEDSFRRLQRRYSNNRIQKDELTIEIDKVLSESVNSFNLYSIYFKFDIN